MRCCAAACTQTMWESSDTNVQHSLGDHALLCSGLHTSSVGEQPKKDANEPTIQPQQGQQCCCAVAYTLSEQPNRLAVQPQQVCAAVQRLRATIGRAAKLTSERGIKSRHSKERECVLRQHMQMKGLGLCVLL